MLKLNYEKKKKKKNIPIGEGTYLHQLLRQPCNNCISMGTSNTPTATQISLLLQSASPSSLMPYIGAYTTRLMMHYSNYTSSHH